MSTVELIVLKNHVYLFNRHTKYVIAHSPPTPLAITHLCYNSLGQRNLIVSDMNLNSQIDWNDTDRIVSNDTRYVSLDGDWWRESSTWQTRQNGSPALTRVGLTRTRLTGLGCNTVPSASSPTGAGTGLLTAVAPADVLPDMSYYISDTMSISSVGNILRVPLKKE